jgi:hypothetical protein
LTLSDLPTEVLSALAGVPLLAILGFIGLRQWRRRQARRALLAQMAAVAADYVQDVLLPDGNGGTFHVDFLLFTGAGIVVADLRDVPGLIYGSDHMDEWTVMDKTRRSTFPNPLGPLYDRMAAVRLLAGEGVPVDGRVVFSDRGSFPKGHPKAVTRLGSLARELPPRTAGEAMLTQLQPVWERVKAATQPSDLRRH